jgi:SAM-dependent methyltransferase
MPLDRELLSHKLSSLPSEIKARGLTYVSEADFYFGLLHQEVAALNPGAKILEVGSGIGLLSLHLADCGYAVHSFEPASDGYEVVHVIRDLVLSSWSGNTPPVDFFDTEFPGVISEVPETYDLILLVNVVEHVQDRRSLFAHLASHSGSGTRIRVICPNYWWPYEPHYGFLALPSKKATYRLQRSRINTLPGKAPDMWDDLSWPTPRQLSRELRSVGFRPTYSWAATQAYANRVVNDAAFVARKAKMTSTFLRWTAGAVPVVAETVPGKLAPLTDLTAIPEH